MTALTAARVPLAVRIRNGRYDGMLTGYLHGAPTFTKDDPGGHRAASFTVDARLGFRSDMIQPYSRVYFYDKAGGDCVWEGDVTHPGRTVSTDGSLLEVQVEGGAERLNDWSGMRIYIDRDMTAWRKNSSTSVIGSSVETGDDRGGSGADSVTLAFASDQHVELNFRCEAIYDRLRQAGQDLGWLNYAWDGGHNSGSPGWIVRALVTAPSTVVRTQTLSLAGSGGSGAVVGGGIPAGADVAFIQLIWTSGSSNTGSSGADIVWVSLLRPIVQAALLKSDGTARPMAEYNDTLEASDVVHDLLGDQLSSAYDGANATIGNGAAFQINHLVFTEGTTPLQILQNLMTFEPSMSYRVGASTPGIDKFSFDWFQRSTVPRYEFVVAVDNYSGGAQAVDQYNEAVAVWRAPTGTLRQTITTQSIPEMTAVGRTRRFFQDMSNVTGDVVNAPQANATVLTDHRYPSNGGTITVARSVVDLWTGRRVQPHQIVPGYLARVVGVNPHPDALNASASNGSSVCSIVSTNYSGDNHSVDVALDSLPWSVFRAIAILRNPWIRRVLKASGRA